MRVKEVKNPYLKINFEISYRVISLHANVFMTLGTNNLPVINKKLHELAML